MNAIWTIAITDLRRFFRHKGNYLSLFAVPMLFVFFLLVPNRDRSQPSKPELTILVENLDQGGYGEALQAQFQHQGLVVVEAEDPRAKLSPRGLRIPRDFSQRLEQSKNGVIGELEWFEAGKPDPKIARKLEFEVQRACLRFSSNVKYAKRQNEPVLPGLKRLRERSEPVQLKIHPAGKTPVPSGFVQVLPGVLVMFLMMNLLLLGGTSIADDRFSGIIERLAVQPLSKNQLVLGKILGRGLLGLTMIGFFAFAGHFLFKLKVEGSLSALFVLLLLYAWDCAALGVLLGASVRNARAIPPLSVTASLLMAALGGCWWPMEIVPPLMQRVGQLFPTTWAMEGAIDILHRGNGWSALLPAFAVLGALALVATALAAKLLKYR